MGALNFLRSILLGILWAVLSSATGLSLRLLNVVETDRAIEIILVNGLVFMTAFYVRATQRIASATERQAEASLKIAEESERARHDSLRPVLVLDKLTGQTLRERLLNRPGVAHFRQEDQCILVSWSGDVLNNGAGPAIQASVLLVIGDSPREKTGTREGPNREDIPPLGSRHAYLCRLGVRGPLTPPEEGELIVRYQDVYKQWFQTRYPLRLGNREQTGGTIRGEYIIELPDVISEQGEESQ